MSKSELEQQSELAHIAREQYGVTSASFLELPGSTAPTPAIMKTVTTPKAIINPGKPPFDALVIVTAGFSEGEFVHGNQRTRGRSSAGTIQLLPAHVHVEQMKWQGVEWHSTVLNVGGALSQLEMPRIGLIDSHVVDLARRLQYQAEHMVPLGLTYVEALMLTLNTYLRARYGRETMSRQRNVGRLSRLNCEDLQAYIDANIRENISLEHLATLVGYSVSHLRVFFNEAFGMPPHQYIIERRVERAKSLALDPNFSMADVASLCGFSSQAHMNMLFKRLTGMTPGSFRRGKD